MVHREITFFFHRRITAVWEHAGNRGLQSLSIQLNCSNFWLSHITHHHTWQFQDVRFSWLSAANLFFACANLWIGIERRSKSIVLQMVLQIVLFFLAIYFTSKPTIYSTILAPDFFLAFSHAAPMTCFFFFKYSCTIFFQHFFVHQIVLFFAFFRAPYHLVLKCFFFFCFFFVHLIVFFFSFFSCTISCFFSSILRAPF